MTGSSAIVSLRAKRASEAHFEHRRRQLRLTAQVMKKSHDLFGLKTVHYVSDITGYSVRSCEAWMGGDVVIPSDALVALQQSVWGREYLVAIMDQNTPRWWLQLKAWWQSIDLAAAEIKHRRKLRELLDASVEARANAPHHPAAALFQDEAFYSGQPYPAPTPRARRRRG